MKTLSNVQRGGGFEYFITCTIFNIQIKVRFVFMSLKFPTLEFKYNENTH